MPLSHDIIIHFTRLGLQPRVRSEEGRIIGEEQLLRINIATHLKPGHGENAFLLLLRAGLHGTMT